MSSAELAATAGNDEFEMDNNKGAIRAQARTQRATLTRVDFAERIARFAADLALLEGAVVAGYDPIRDEADPRLLMSALVALGHALALPCVVAARTALVFRDWKMGDALTPNTYGIAEPLPGAREVVPDVVLVPMLAFDARGHRLGYGGGYYDRTFEALPHARRVGVAYAGQELRNVPREPHDHRLDMIVTENGVWPFHET
jgi:5-formyltetrahydrofolate cyclo-ligase